MKDVGIAILSYFRPDRLKKCIDSLKENTTTPFDLYFVDNASDEETKNYIRSVCKENGWHAVMLGENVGWMAGKNACLWMMRDHPIQILMENDWMFRSLVDGKDWIQLHLWAMEKLGLPILHGRPSVRESVDEGCLLRVVKNGVNIRLHNDLFTCMVIMKKEVVDAVGGFHWKMVAPWGAFVDVEWGERIVRFFSQKTGLVFHVSLSESLFEFNEIFGSDYPNHDKVRQESSNMHSTIFMERRKWIWETATLEQLKEKLIPLGKA